MAKFDDLNTEMPSVFYVNKCFKDVLSWLLPDMNEINLNVVNI